MNHVPYLLHTWLLRTDFGFVRNFKKASSAPVSEGRSYSLRRDKKNPKLKYAPAGPLLQDTTTFRMICNGFLLGTKRCEIKMSVVSMTRETGMKRRDFSWFIIVYNIIKSKRMDCKCGQNIVILPFALISAEWNSELVMLLIGQVTSQAMCTIMYMHPESFLDSIHLHRSTHGASRNFSGYNSEPLQSMVFYYRTGARCKYGQIYFFHALTTITPDGNRSRP